MEGGDSMSFRIFHIEYQPTRPHIQEDRWENPQRTEFSGGLLSKLVNLWFSQLVDNLLKT